MMQDKMRGSKRSLSRRFFLRGCAAVGAASLIEPTSVFAAPPPVRPDRRPNLVLLVTDDQRWDSMGCAGNAILKTPNIDSLAAKGVMFDQSFTTCAICMASRASIFTGLYTRSHGIDNFSKPLPAPLFKQSYPMLLRHAGYRTGFVGKWGLGGALPKDDFDYFAGFTGQGRYFAAGSTKHLTTVQAEQAVEFIRGCRRDQPFCLSVSFKAPHVQDEGRNRPGIYAKYPYDRALESMYSQDTIAPPGTTDAAPMPAFLDKTINKTREAPDFSPENYQETMKSLYRLVSGVDIAVGAILDAVRQLGVEDNTVIIYTSDHGSFYGEHGFGGKWLMLEESIRTPMIICDPRAPRELHGTRRQEMVLNIDRAPTLLELAGVSIAPDTQGRSLVPLSRGQHPAWRSDWFYEHAYRGSADSPIAASEGVRTERWKYVRYIDEVPAYEQLFDLHADPREERNLADASEHRQTLDGLRQRWTAWRTQLDGWRQGKPWTEPLG